MHRVTNHFYSLLSQEDTHFTKAIGSFGRMKYFSTKQGVRYDM